MTDHQNEELEPIDGPRGQALIDAINNKIRARGDSPDVLSNLLGYTDRHFRVLMNGQRWFGAIGHEKLRIIADYLGIPYARVFVLAGILSPSDFIFKNDIENLLLETYSDLQKDNVIGMAVPAKDQWDATPIEVKLLVATLHNRLKYERGLLSAASIRTDAEKNFPN